MDYHIWWIVLLVFGSRQITANKDILDFTVVYRTPYKTSWPPPDYVEKIKEYHRSGNAKGMLLKIDDDYIDSVEGMVPLNCAPATSACQWEYSNSWNFVAVNTSVDQDFTINIGEEDQEEKTNCPESGCSHICFENGRPECRCTNATRHILNENCINVRGQIIIKSSIAEIPLFSSSLVVPPKNAITFGTVSPQSNWEYGLINLYEVFVNEVMEYNNKRQILQINSVDDGTKHFESSRLLEITSNCILSIGFRREHLALAEIRGSLSYDILPVLDGICVSVIYTTPESNGDMKLVVGLANGTIFEVSKYTDREFGDWKMRSFISFGKMANDKVNLRLEISGKGTILHSIFGCNPFGPRDITVFKNAVSSPKLNTLEDLLDRCLNGGKYDSTANVCICPEGFSGDRCEEGCGPHYFGRNCSAECSNFATGCRGMIFCKKYMSCRCATGFQGNFCEKDCESGYYGASCTQRCGNCEEYYCDRFTGYCPHDCQPGFRRPFCRTRHTHFQEAVWTELQPQKVRDTLIRRNISNLLPGVKYEVRVIYIDKDGNSYQQSVPSTSFSSFCTVPTSMNYNLEAISMSSRIDLIWKYETNKTDCPVTGYTIVLERNVVKVQRNVSGHETSFTFSTLLPGVSYQVKIKANTAYGNAHFSSPLSVKTIDEAPLHVSNLQVTERDSRKLRVSWKPPRFSGGSLQYYLVKYQCIRFLACEESCTRDAKEIRVAANQNYADLEVLRPHAQYYISVAAKSGILGPYTSFKAVTQDTAPDAAPEMSETPIVTSTNVTISVQWLPLKSCTFLNGYLVGYGYMLYSENRTVVATGNTTNTHIAFDNLTPQASYFVHIYAISTGDWSRDKQLIINASTAASVNVENNSYQMVRARNILVSEYGEFVTVKTVTSENVPEAPTSLFVSSRTSDSITLKWGPPDIFNGILRSFLINVEQLDSANSSSCCVYSPLLEVPVKSEDRYYEHKVTDLMPASKYIISVSAKTISIGPSAFLTVSTSPETPNLTQAPKVLDNNRVKLPLGEGFPGIKGTYLLLVFPPNGNFTSTIWNSEIREKLYSLVPTNSFYVVEEYNAEDMQSSQEEKEYEEVQIVQGKGPRNGTIGLLEDPDLPSDFRVGLALVLDYNGAVSVGFTLAEEAKKNDSETEDT
ncbi:Protein draper [Gryllus bimaculatus]|nr:Protein draper [Gryllus bimaculatus]